MATKSDVSNIRSTQLPSRAEVLDDLTSLTTELQLAKDAGDDTAVAAARFSIDHKLERLLSIASEAEFGAMGTAPT